MGFFFKLSCSQFWLRVFEQSVEKVTKDDKNKKTQEQKQEIASIKISKNIFTEINFRTLVKDSSIRITDFKWRPTYKTFANRRKLHDSVVGGFFSKCLLGVLCRKWYSHDKKRTKNEYHFFWLGWSVHSQQLPSVLSTNVLFATISSKLIYTTFPWDDCFKVFYVPV